MMQDTKTPAEIWASHPRWKRVLAYSAGGLLALVILLVAVAPEPAKPQLTPEQQREATIKAQFNPWDGSHIATERAIKDRLNDPDSYQHVETRYFMREDGTMRVMTHFRAKNAFGGVVLNRWASEVDKAGNVLSVGSLD